jgi:sulfoxide reductase heme-binding subunit YedZ
MNARMVNGWALLGLVSVLLLAVAGLCLASYAFDVTGVRLVIRATARTSLILFARQLS